ncbi:hypothetical protein DENSPDRAFT_563912 [Dentipellis sp. KUC8613]|nr:hypothetical protein DENSPDRAFT_563912 [Dentipellis sp. KUC8613]
MELRRWVSRSGSVPIRTRNPAQKDRPRCRRSIVTLICRHPGLRNQCLGAFLLDLCDRVAGPWCARRRVLTAFVFGMVCSGAVPFVAFGCLQAALGPVALIGCGRYWCRIMSRFYFRSNHLEYRFTDFETVSRIRNSSEIGMPVCRFIIPCAHTLKLLLGRLVIRAVTNASYYRPIPSVVHLVIQPQRTLACNTLVIVSLSPPRYQPKLSSRFQS